MFSFLCFSFLCFSFFMFFFFSCFSFVSLLMNKRNTLYNTSTTTEFDGIPV